MHYITDKNGAWHTVEEYGWMDGKATVCIDHYKISTLKMYYRHERTWDDHMGNTPCGYYVIVPIPVYNGKHENKRVYLRFA